ncbi:MAG: B12-binding domain-containing radical SAM protein [Lachnospiraceae bacterium]|nr:B12-binding domain-containing radical SAM protein [Lachnospiraceae bacterium]
MKCLLVAINAKYIHSNLAVYSLKACAEAAARDRRGAPGIRVELAEYTINHRAAEILDDIYEKEADILCFSCYIWNIDHVKALVRNLKRLRPQVPVWLGGPEVSFDVRERLTEIPEADGILYGEGERSFPELLRLYGEGGFPAGTDGREPLPGGCAWRRGDGEIVVAPPAEPVGMDEIPFVYGAMWEEADFKDRILYYETGRGCPFSCGYCLSSVDKRLRFRSLSRVYEELGFFLEKKVSQVKFVDRTFNCKKDRALAVWTFLRDHDNGVTNFHFEIGAELLDEECFALLETVRPGLLRLEIGVQSANPETLRAVRRVTDLEKLRLAAVRTGRKRNVLRHLDLIAGLPFEDYESFGRSFDEVYSMEPDELQLGFLKVLKGTPLYEEAGTYPILYQAEAPYEVLETPWLSHDDLIRLKRVEEMVEIYYNSRQFLYSMKFLLPFFGRPFLLYEGLGRTWKDRGMGRRRHVRSALYQFLLDYAEQEIPGAAKELRKPLTFDYYLRENAKSRPGFAPSQEPYREEIRRRLLARFPETPFRQLLRETHVEVFRSSLTGEEEYWMFDYGNRDPLTGNARPLRL